VLLRAFAMVSLALGLYYNLTLEGGVLWLVVFWLSIFFCINTVRISTEIVDNMEAKLSPRMKMVLASAFPTMHTRDWSRIEKIASTKTYGPGEVMLDIGGHTNEISVLVSGESVEHRLDGRVLARQAGTFWGELTYMLGACDFEQGSPCRIVAGEKGAVVLTIPYAPLRTLAARSERLRAALAEGVVRSAGTKHGLLDHSWESVKPAGPNRRRPAPKISTQPGAAV